MVIYPHSCSMYKVKSMLKPLKICFLTLICATLISCVDQPSTENTVEYLDSAAVTKKVKTKLVEQLGTPGFSIRVRTYRDEVLLSGVVDNATIQRKAGEIAANVENVKHVRNDLVVK